MLERASFKMIEPQRLKENDIYIYLIYSLCCLVYLLYQLEQ